MLRFHPWTREKCRCCLEEYITGDTARTLRLPPLLLRASDRRCPEQSAPHCSAHGAVCCACQLRGSAPGSARPRLGLAETCGPLTAPGVHRRCIDRWLRANVHCPLCKTPERMPQNSTRTVRIGACTAVGMVRARLAITEYMHRTLAAAAHAIRPAEWRLGRTRASLGGSMRNGSRRLAVARVALGAE